MRSGIYCSFNNEVISRNEKLFAWRMKFIFLQLCYVRVGIFKAHEEILFRHNSRGGIVSEATMLG